MGKSLVAMKGLFNRKVATFSKLTSSPSEKNSFTKLCNGELFSVVLEAKAMRSNSFVKGKNLLLKVHA